MTIPNKPLAEITVRDVVDSYDDAFDPPAKVKPAADEAPAATVPDGTVEKPVPAKDPVTGRFVKADGSVEPPVHSSYWMRKALEVGLSEDECLSMDAAELRQAVQTETFAAQNARRETESVQPVKETPFPEIQEGDFDDKLSTFLAAVTKRLDALETREGQRARLAAMNKLDTLFSKDKTIFGDGPTEDLDPRSPEAIRRRMLVGSLNELARTGKKTTLAKDYALFRTVFGAATKEPSEEVPETKNRVNERAKEWAAGGVEKPTHREKPNHPPGIKAAKETFMNGLAEIQAAEREAGGTDENDELPG